MNNRCEEFINNFCDKKTGIEKWNHYPKIYDKYFNRFKGKNPNILEIGVKPFLNKLKIL